MKNAITGNFRLKLKVDTNLRPRRDQEESKEGKIKSEFRKAVERL